MGGVKSHSSGERSKDSTAARALRDTERFFDRTRRIDPVRHRRAVQRVRAAWRELGEAIAALDDVDEEGQ